MFKFAYSVQLDWTRQNLSSMLVAFSLFLSSQAFSHGEDKPGPHGGYVRMPGAFHTELVQEGESTFSVYLLDLEWKNPTTKDSSVEAVLKGKIDDKKLTCLVQEERFNCTLPTKTKIQKGNQILITARRQGIQGNGATYALPLSFSQSHVKH